MTAFLRTVAVLSVLAPAAGTAGAQTLFRIEESTIADVQNAIKSGQTTCRAVVQAYLDRAKAYNGTCTALVTADGAPIPPATGAVRAGAPITFPTTTVPVAKVFPDFSEYAGRPFEFGRMEPTISDPSVQQQFGMRVGIPNAGQIERARDAQHSRRALDHLQGRLRSGAVGRPAATRRAARVRSVPEATGRTRARRGAGRAIRSQPRSDQAADVLRRVLAQELVRREGHARHRRQRRQLRDGRAESRFARHRRAPGQGRDHLRRGYCQQHRRSVRARRRQRAVSAARRQPRLWGLGRPDLQSLRHRTSAARHQRWLGDVGGGQPGRLLDLRAELGLVQRTGIAEQRRQSPHHEGHSPWTAA